jgi:hypothetical protein
LSGCDALLSANKHLSAEIGSGDEKGAALLSALASTEVPSPAYCEDEVDSLGKRLFLSLIEVEMDPNTKQCVISAHILKRLLYSTIT